jgi:hypothetical protein
MSDKRCVMRDKKRETGETNLIRCAQGLSGPRALSLLPLAPFSVRCQPHAASDNNVRHLLGFVKDKARIF